MTGFTPDAIGLLRSYIRHRAYLRVALDSLRNDLQRRADVHDLSKLLDDEFEGFSRINAAARINKFGSPEYAEGMRRERPTIDLHFSRNSHHVEYGEQSWLDIVEMVCDWWAARQGYADNQKTWDETVELNLKHKGHRLSPEQLWLVRQVAAGMEVPDGE